MIYKTTNKMNFFSSQKWKKILKKQNKQLISGCQMKKKDIHIE